LSKIQEIKKIILFSTTTYSKYHDYSQWAEAVAVSGSKHLRFGMAIALT